jgi:REP element-mobilizing transposase RayT
MTTNEYIRAVKVLGWQRFTGKLWQRNYWEHVIRDQKSFDMISEYITNNPKNWQTDKLNNL